MDSLSVSGAMLAFVLLGLAVAAAAAETAAGGRVRGAAAACLAGEDGEEASLLQRNGPALGPALSQAGGAAASHAGRFVAGRPKGNNGVQRCTAPGACQWQVAAQRNSSTRPHPLQLLGKERAEPLYIGAGCCRPNKSFMKWSAHTTKDACMQACRDDNSCQAYVIAGCSSAADPICGGSCFLYDMSGNQADWYASQCGNTANNGNAFCYTLQTDGAFPPGWSDNTITVHGDKRSYALYTCPGCEGQTVPLVMVGPGTSETRWDTPWKEIQRYADAGSYAVVILEGEDLSFNVGGAHTKPVPEIQTDDEQYVIDVVRDLRGFTRGRTFCMGFSRGARFCGLLTSSQRLQAAGIYFGAYGAIAGVRFSYPMFGTPVPVFAVHETSDPVNRYCGHKSENWQMSVPDAVRNWAAWNECRDPHSAASGCQDPCVQVHDYPRFSDTTYFRCDACARWHSSPDVQVVLAKVSGASHMWTPQAIQLILTFFDKYKGPLPDQLSYAS